LKLLFFANTDWYLFNFRRSLAAKLRDEGHEVVLVSPPGPYAEKLRQLGFRLVPAPMDRASLNPLRELALIGWLWRLMRRERPDVVHGFTVKCAIYGALVGRMLGTGSVNGIEGRGYVFVSDALKARLLRPVLCSLLRASMGGRRSRLILLNCDDVSFFERARIVSAQKIRLIRGPGVDCAQFSASEGASHRDLGPMRVVLAARLLWDKGIAEFVEAARLLRREHRPLQFLLAGAPDKGNPAAVPEETILGWQMDGLVQWLGHVNDMPTLYRGADIVVLPSYYGEGLPKSLIEAAACARPLITTDMPGCREVVTHEKDGLLVPPRDAAALARAIARLQDDPALAHRLGAAARAKALAEFDERIVIARTLAVYQEVLSEG